MAAQRWAVAFLAHNGEEVLLGLPTWAARQPQLGWMAMAMPAGRFLPTVVLLSALVIALALWGVLQPRRWTERMLLLFSTLMLANGLSHIGLSIVTGSLMPGAMTSVLVLIPAMGWIIATRRLQAP